VLRASAIQLSCVLDCADDADSCIQWFEGSTLLGEGHELTLSGALRPTQTTTYTVLLNDGTLAQPLAGYITILVNPESEDANGDGQNTLDDLREFLPAWSNPSLEIITDPSLLDGRPGLDVRDYLFISLGF
jgi:hypothetical protein